jgi:hypothetical protein
MTTTRKLRSLVVLTALGEGNSEVEVSRIGLDEYYDESCELIDSSSYRAAKGIRTIKGEIHDPEGRLSQSFENRYNSLGDLVRSRAVHADGTITEQVLDP